MGRLQRLLLRAPSITPSEVRQGSLAAKSNARDRAFPWSAVFKTRKAGGMVGSVATSARSATDVFTNLCQACKICALWFWYTALFFSPPRWRCPLTTLRFRPYATARSVGTLVRLALCPCPRDLPAQLWQYPTSVLGRTVAKCNHLRP